MIANFDAAARGGLAGMERDLAAAGQLQRMLLPPSPLTSNGWKAVHHYQPAGIVSGDYVDLVRHDGRLYFMLGDVSGKGVVASILMAQLHAMFRALIPFDLSMEELMRRASALLCASSLPAQYATLVFGYFTSDGEAVLANAGHQPPLVMTGAHNSEVRATGLPIGLFCESQFSSTRLALAKGDTLLMYTDGVTEAERPGGEDYGVHRLEQVARRTALEPVEQVVEQIVADQLAFRGPMANSDDMSILAVRRL